jgi:dimethylargininase
MLVAITRPLSPRLAEGERTFVDREPIDMTLASAQHHTYEEWLAAQGCAIVKAAPLPDAADGVFVEDTAVVLDEIAVITRPGALSRRIETESVDVVLRRFRKTVRMYEGTLDGGDVIRAGRTIYIGQSARTTDRGIAHFRSLVASFGYNVVPVTMNGALHLKTAATRINDQTVIYNPDWVEPRAFSGMELIAIDPAEPHAGNVLSIGDTLLMPAEFARTRAILEQRGFNVDTVPISEMMKAEAGVTCSSIVFDD